MKSKKGFYRIITAPKGRYRYQFQPEGSSNWLDGAFNYRTVEEAMAFVNDLVELDDFEPQVIDLQQKTEKYDAR